MLRISIGADVARQTSKRIGHSRAAVGQARVDVVQRSLDQTMRRQHHVITRACVDQVRLIGQGQYANVLTGHVDEVAADDVIIACPAKDRIRALTADQQIAPGAADDKVRPARSSLSRGGKDDDAAALTWDQDARGDGSRKPRQDGMVAKGDVFAIASGHNVRATAADQHITPDPAGQNVIARRGCEERLDPVDYASDEGNVGIVADDKVIAANGRDGIRTDTANDDCTARLQADRVRTSGRCTIAYGADQRSD